MQPSVSWLSRRTVSDFDFRPLKWLADNELGLESTCWALQGQKDLLLRDVDIAEASVEKVTQELDQCKAQLSAAQSNIKHLQAEKTAIGQQRDQAVAQLAVAKGTLETMSQEKNALIDENEKLKAQIALLMQNPAAKEDSTLEHSVFDPADADDFKEGPLDMDSLSMMNQQKHNEQHEEQQVEQHVEQKKPAHCNNSSFDSSHNITYLSYAGDSSICKVRKTLEQERKARQLRRQAEATNKRPTNEPKENSVRLFEGPARQNSESSVIRRPERQSIPRNDLTSGFILPDITFNLKPTTESQAALPAHQQPPFDVAQYGNAQHHAEQVDLLDLAPIEAREQPGQHTAEPLALPQISDEELDITINDDETSVRPSQPPDVALAVVMESLRTELTSQRSQLAKYQSSYDRQDVALGRRQRKQLLGKIQALLASCDVKADQIYNLHDVIEGHKQNGQPITQNQVDNTLQSLGLDLPWEGIESTNATAARRRSTASSRSI